MRVKNRLLEGTIEIDLNGFWYESITMSETPDVNVKESDCFREIIVTGQISNMNYDGLKLTILHDSLNLQEAVKGSQIKASKTTINRQIECTLNLSPLQLKSWAILFQKELKKYEDLFGTILSPEEVQEKFKKKSN